MATVNLGRLKPVFKGAYNSSTAYVIDDIVTYANETYINIQAGTNQQPNTATGYWTKLAAKGTDGTDVGATLTTQGDILYRDGSGLQRLAAGTAGQVLQTGGSGANPSWTAVASDCVKLATASTTSNHATIDVEGYFDDTVYGSYKLVMHSIKPENNAGEIQAKWLTGANTTHDNSNYLVLHTGWRSGSSDGQQERAVWNANNLGDWEGTWTPKNTSASDDDYCSMVAHIINPKSTSQGKVMIYQWNSMSTTQSIMVITQGAFFTKNTTAMTGFRLYRTNNNFHQSAWELYGFKK